MSSSLLRGFVAAVTLGLLACDGASFGQPGDPGTVDPPAVALATLSLEASSGQLSSNASDPSDGITLTATGKDVFNNVIPGVSVRFSVDADGTLSPAGLAVTDADGKAQKILTTGGNPQNRTMTVTATAGGLTRTVTINVVGTTLVLSGEDNTQIDEPTVYTVSLLDADGGGIFGKSVTITTEAGNILSHSSVQPGDTNTIVLTTNASGLATATLRATVANTTVTATALGLTETVNVAVSTDEFSFQVPALGPDGAPPEIDIKTDQDVTVEWLQSNVPVPDGTPVDLIAERGVFTAGGTISAAGSKITATTVGGLATVTLSSDKSGLSELRASSTALTRPSTRRTVEFVAVTPDRIAVQASPGVISTNQSSEIIATVFDVDENLVKGQEVEFFLDDLSSGSLSTTVATTSSQGLARINYNSSSQPSSTDGVVITARLKSNPLIEDSVSLTVGSSSVGIGIGQGSQIILKDESTYQFPFTIIVSDSSGQGVPDADFSLSVHPIRFFKGTFGGRSAECFNEDLDLDDRLDPLEDTDGDGFLDPGRVVTITPPDSLDEDGSGQAFVTYPKDRGTFVTVRITGVVRVPGTESRSHLDFTLPIAEADEDNLPGISPYGTVGSGDIVATDGSVDPGCSSPN